MSSVGQIHVPEKRRIEAVRMAVRVSDKGTAIETIISRAETFNSYYKDGTVPTDNKQGASA